MAKVYAAILNKFPRPLAFCFAYGSGVKQQAGKQLAQRQVLDLVLAVDQAQQWHHANLHLNRDQYSSLARLGSGTITKIQERSGASLYYNTLLPLPEHDILYKYGVVTTHHLIQDLLDWRHMYLAGRLHKPVKILIQPTSQDLSAALNSNLSSAVSAALLLLPEKFTEFELYHAISNLSYSGDFRMIFGENKNKVKNIVTPQLENFKKLYSPILSTFSEYVNSIDGEMYVQNITTDAKFHHLSNLPNHPKEIIRKIMKNKLNRETDELFKIVAENDADKIVQRSLQTIVWRSSVTQSLKGILTAGLIKSLMYSAKKIRKMF